MGTLGAQGQSFPHPHSCRGFASSMEATVPATGQGLHQMENVASFTGWMVTPPPQGAPNPELQSRDWELRSVYLASWKSLFSTGALPSAHSTSPGRPHKTALGGGLGAEEPERGWPCSVCGRRCNTPVNRLSVTGINKAHPGKTEAGVTGVS